MTFRIYRGLTPELKRKVWLHGAGSGHNQSPYTSCGTDIHYNKSNLTHSDPKAITALTMMLQNFKSKINEIFSSSFSLIFFSQLFSSYAWGKKKSLSASPFVKPLKALILITASCCVFLFPAVVGSTSTSSLQTRIALLPVPTFPISSQIAASCRPPCTEPLPC